MKFFKKYYIITIILLVLIYYLTRYIYSENFIDHGYGTVDIKETTLEVFNNKSNTNIVILPENIYAISIIDGEVFIVKNLKESKFDFHDYLIKDFIPFIIKYVYPYIKERKIYFLFNVWDGHGERIDLYNIENISYYMADGEEFKNKAEINLNNGKFPLLHNKKYILTSCKLKKDIYSKAIPDRYFISSAGQQDLIAQIKNSRGMINWEQKKNELIWRGNIVNGTKYNFKNYVSELNQREYFVDLYKKGILHNINYSEETMSKEEMCKYKYLLDIDGFSNTWDATIWKMLSGSVMLKVDGVWEQWYYPKLKEWVHYIPVKHDFSDLNEILQWCYLNDEICKKVSENAYNFVLTELTFEKACEYTIDIFNKYVI